MAVNNTLARKNGSGNGNNIKNLIQKYQGEISKALPKDIPPQRFARIATSAVSNNPTLAQCDAMSFISALMNAAQLGLEPNTPLGQAYLIPYRNHGQLQCQFQLGYKGMIQLARKGGATNISAEVVYENDEFSYELGLDPKLTHKPALSNRGNPVAYYAAFHLSNGGYGFKVMSYDDIQEYAKKYSKAYSSSSSPWQTNFDEMAKKTVLKQALKYAPMSTEALSQIETDESVKHQISEDMSSVKDDFSFEEADYEVREESSAPAAEAAEKKAAPQSDLL